MTTNNSQSRPMHERRQKMLESLIQLIGDDKFATLLEKKAYNYTIELCNNRGSIPSWNNPHMQIYFTIMSRIQRNWRPELVKIKISELILLTEEELDPSWMASARQDIKERSNIHIEEKIETHYICGNCKCNKTKVRSVQTRSSDEPPTIFVKCVECGHKWTAS